MLRHVELKSIFASVASSGHEHRQVRKTYRALAPWQAADGAIDTRVPYRVELGHGLSIGAIFAGYVGSFLIGLGMVMMALSNAAAAGVVLT